MLTNVWTAAGGMLGDLLRGYLDKEQDRPSGADDAGRPLKFINKKRREWLEDKDMTVRHTMEFLSVLDLLPFGLYGAARRSSTVRNNWLHGKREPTYNDSAVAIRLAGGLFELLEASRLTFWAMNPSRG